MQVGVCLLLFACSQSPRNSNSAFDLTTDAEPTEITNYDGSIVTIDAGIMNEDDSMPNENEPNCDERDCGENAYCDMEINDCRCLEGYRGTPPDACTKIPIPTGWIGSTCSKNEDCQYEGGFCDEAPNFPDGHCTMSCTRYCPDRADEPVTFCAEADPEQGGQCFSRCDTSIFPSNEGCRENYSCHVWPRFNEPNVIRNICVPTAWLENLPCTDTLNFAGSNDCYLKMVSFENNELRRLSEAILEGSSSATTAQAWLELNFRLSQNFITDKLGRTINPNYSSGHRSTSPMRGAIVHYTAAAREDSTIGYFVSSSPHASTHFVIGSQRNGLIVQIFSHRHRTWHAGSTYNHDHFGIDFANAGYLIARTDGGFEDYAGRRYDLNLPLYGNSPIEVENGIPEAERKYSIRELWQPYTYYQLVSFILLGRALDQVYSLQRNAIKRHGDVSASRVDPGPHLPYRFLLDAMFDRSNVFDLDWLNAYKQERDWISRHPEAR